MASSGKVKIDALKTLLDSAREIVADLADESMERALRALADLPAEERDGVALALDRAVTAWRANEAFAPLHKVQMRANPHAQLFVRVFDPVPEQTFEQNDIVPETLRIMRRIGVLMHPEALAIWEPAVASALSMLTPEELKNCVRFVERVLAAVTARKADTEQSEAREADEMPLTERAGRNQKAGSQAAVHERRPTRKRKDLHRSR
jgi:hypothetical protein